MLTRLTFAAVALTLVCAAPAAADSIAYIQDNDIWLATPDGARKQQVTHTGGYFYVSQADDGTLAALVGGEKIQKLSRTGQVLAEFSTFVSDGSPVGGPVTQFHGPFDPEISPDGSKIAFEYFNDTYDAAPGCNELTVPPCYAYTQSQGVGITNSTGFTGVEAYGLMTGWVAPHWVSNDTLLRSSPGANLNDDAVFSKLGTPGIDPWFYDPNQGLGVDDVELSRDLQTVVGIAGFYSEKLRVYRTTMSPFGAPDWDHTPFTNHENVPVAQQCYELPGKFLNTTLAPSGKAMAYSDAAGVHVASIPDNCAPGDAGALVFPGAKHPDWGVADVPPASAFTSTPGSTPSSSPAPASSHAPAAKKKLRLSVTRKGKVTVTVPSAGKVTVTAKRGSRTVAKRSKTAKAAGKVTFKLKLRGKVTVTATQAGLRAKKVLRMRA
jgi:hypothetical protein